LPQSNPNCDAGKSDANGYSYGYIYAGKSDADSYSYSNGNGNNHTTSDYADTDTIGDPASADAKAAAHAVPSADAVRMIKD
jgi:hypothetical protein